MATLVPLETMATKEAQASMLAQERSSSPTHPSASARPFPDPLEAVDRLDNLVALETKGHLASLELLDPKVDLDNVALLVPVETLETVDHLDALDNSDLLPQPHRAALAPLVAPDLPVPQDALVDLDRMVVPEPLDSRETVVRVEPPAALEAPEPLVALASPEPPEAATTAHRPVWPLDTCEAESRRRDRDQSQGVFVLKNCSCFYFAFIFCWSVITKQ